MDLTYKCSQCSMELIDLKAANNILEKPQVDSVIVCGGCNCYNVITLTGTRKLSDKEFDEMHPDDKKDLAFAARAVKRNLRN